MKKQDTKILVVDDDVNHADTLKDVFLEMGYRCKSVYSGAQAIKLLEEEHFDALITDLVMKDVDGFEVIKNCRRYSPDAVIIVMTAYGSVEVAVKAMKNGATDFVTKPINLEELKLRLNKELANQARQRENIELKKQLQKRFSFENIVGNSPQIIKIIEKLKVIAPTPATVLLEGESGVGKELIAQTIHTNSGRQGNFVPLNCAALPETILESELFGHEKGAFTGAIYQRKGRFEYADKGTLFLDEIGDLPLSIQIKLLRAVETREIYRLGSNEPIKVDVRIITATNKDLEELVKQGKFREDLYYRLKVISIKIPPLRERIGDISLLVDHFIKEFSYRYNKPISYITREALVILERYSWPGNVRELKNCIEYMIATTTDNILNVDDVPDYIKQAPPQETMPALTGISLAQMEKTLILNTLKSVDGNRAMAAKILGISERTLYRKIHEYGLEV
jgi:two-component system response regulator HydG